MFKIKFLIAAGAITIPSMASACDLHGDFGFFGGMHFSNMSLANSRQAEGYSNSPASANHGGNQGVRHVQFSRGDTFDDEPADYDMVPDPGQTESAYNPEDAATFR